MRKSIHGWSSIYIVPLQEAYFRLRNTYVATYSQLISALYSSWLRCIPRIRFEITYYVFVNSFF